MACMASHGRRSFGRLAWAQVANDMVTQGHECLVLTGRLLDEELPVMASSSVSTRAPASRAILPIVSRLALATERAPQVGGKAVVP